MRAKLRPVGNYESDFSNQPILAVGRVGFFSKQVMRGSFGNEVK